MRLEVCNVLSTAPRTNQDETKGNCGQVLVTHDGLCGSHTHTHTSIHRKDTHTDVNPSWAPGAEGKRILVARPVWGFWFHFVVTSPATNRHNVRCLLHLTSSFSAHPERANEPGSPRALRVPTCVVSPVSCAIAPSISNVSIRSQNLIDFDSVKFDMCPAIWLFVACACER